MNSKEFKQELINEILLNIKPSYYKNYELNVRCPFCGDSIKNANSAHLSIRINPDDDQPLVFRCLRCNSTGLFNGTTLTMIGIYTNSNSVNIERYNRLSCKKHGLTFNKKGLNIKFPELKITESVMQKHKYIENRLGIKLDIEELHNKKIVYDFLGLMKYNHIEKLYGQPDHLKALQTDHVGFLSARNDFINFSKLENILYSDLGSGKAKLGYEILETGNSLGQGSLNALVSGDKLVAERNCLIVISTLVNDVISLGKRDNNKLAFGDVGLVAFSIGDDRLDLISGIIIRGKILGRNRRSKNYGSVVKLSAGHKIRTGEDQDTAKGENQRNSQK